MYKLSLSILLTVISNVLISQNKLQLNDQQANQFVDIINYIKTTDSIEFPFNSKISIEQEKYYYNKHKNDAVLNDKINNLLEIPIYKALQRNFHAWDGKKQLNNSEAYQYAFWSLPKKDLRITGGITNIWMEYFTKNKQQSALSFIDSLDKRKSEIENNVLQKSWTYLPQQIISKDVFSVYLGFDGNRGSFEDKEGIFIELLYQRLNIIDFELTLAHELHHQYYTKYLAKKFGKKPKPALQWQNTLLLEGTAQLINYESYPDEIKGLYQNEKLLNELFIEFCNTLQKIDSTKNKKQTVDRFWDYYFQDFSVKKFNEYLPNPKNRNDVIGYRPTLHYYLGYTIFHTIYKNKGIDELFKVMLNPENLLTIFNQSREKKCILPEFSKEIIALWEKNFE
jgi:hypothetical protein